MRGEHWKFAASLSFSVLMLALLIAGDERPDREAEAIRRGYALHCPRDGRFAWKGECNE